MSNSEVALLMGLLPILYFLFYLGLHQQPTQVSTTILGRKGRVVGATDTHLLISLCSRLNTSSITHVVAACSKRD